MGEIPTVMRGTAHAPSSLPFHKTKLKWNTNFARPRTHEQVNPETAAKSDQNATLDSFEVGGKENGFTQ